MKKIESIIYILLIIFFMISIVPKELQNDTFFTIAGGRLILENGIQKEEQLVWHDNLEFTNSRWLFDVLITVINEKFDFFGIYIFVIVIAIITGLSYYYILFKITKKSTISFFITIISMYFLSTSFTARAQIISNFLLLIEFYCLEKIKNIEKLKKKYIVALIIIPVLFANMHASTFPIYLIVFLPFIAEYILSKILFVKSEGSKLIFEVKNIGILLILFILGIISGLATPIIGAPYTDMINVTKGISYSFIQELQPTTIFNNIYFSAVLILTISILIFSKQKIRVSDGLFILGFTILTFNSARSFYYFIIISNICFTRIFVEFLDNYNFEITRRTKHVLIIFGVCVIIINSINSLLNNIKQNYIGNYPVKTAQYIIKNIDTDNMRIYNGFNYGSYLEYRGIQAFIDSRSGVFTEEFNPGCTILQDWLDVSDMAVNYNDIFDKYEITHVLLYNTEPIVNYIKVDPKWKMLYQDDGFILYERAS